MKILVTGSNGTLGTAIKEVFKDHELICPAKYQMNIGMLSSVMRMAANKPEYIIHAAAETDHEYCDMNPSQCYLINTIGTANLMRLAKFLDIPILYVSAASTFDGKKGYPYIPTDEQNPINHYNASKFFGELVLKSYDNFRIIRAGWLFGGGPKLDKKFVHKIITKINDGHKEIKVANDCIGSPTYSKDFAMMMLKIVNGLPPGIYHGCNGQGCSRYDMAVEIVKILGVDVKITPVSIDDLAEEFPCKRTNYEVVESSFPFRQWKDALKEYLNAYYRH